MTPRSPNGWRRVGRTSGPGNLLNGRWLVERYGDSGWVVCDGEQLDQYDHPKIVAGEHHPYPTMRSARIRAEAMAASAS